MEKERLMGYKIGATGKGLATIQQQSVRLGQAMYGNSLIWLGEFLHATQK